MTAMEPQFRVEVMTVLGTWLYSPVAPTLAPVPSTSGQQAKHRAWRVDRVGA